MRKWLVRRAGLGRRLVLIGMLLLLAAAGPVWAQAALPLHFRSDPGWQARPSFLGNPARDFRVEARDGAVELIVEEPGKGMKFELPLAAFDCSTAEYLLLRYRASNLGPGYALWANTGGGPGRQWLGTADLKCDGERHTLALDLVGLRETGSVTALLTEVQCRQAPARIAFVSLVPADEVPAGADVWPKERPKAAEFAVRAVDLAAPRPQPGWLATPSTRATAQVTDGLLHLRVEGPGSGMKWAAPLKEWPDLTPYCFAVVRYRAVGLNKVGDYFLWLGSEAGGAPQKSAQVIQLQEVEADGEWQSAVVPLDAPFRPAEVALQVQSRGESAEAWIESIRFASERPLLAVGDLLPVTRGHEKARLPLAGARLVDLAAFANQRAGARLRRFGLSGWPEGGDVTVRGIPFRLGVGERNVVETPASIEETLTLPLQGEATEVYLLLAAKLAAQDLARVGDGIPLRAFSNPERFVVRVTYADGVTDEVFPVRVGKGRHEVGAGIDVYCLTPLRKAPLKSLALRNRMRPGAFLVGGLTLNTGKPLTPQPDVASLPPAVPTRAADPGPGRIEKRGDAFVVGNALLRLEIGIGPGLSLRAAENLCLAGGKMRVEPGPLFALGVGEKLVPSTEIPCGTPVVRTEGSRKVLAVPFDASSVGVPLRGEFLCSVGEGPDVRLALRAALTGDAPARPVVHFPIVSGVVLGSAEETWYLWGRKGGLVNRTSCSERQWYGGQYPLQVADLFNPALGGGLSLATYDRDNLYKQWCLVKDDRGGHWRIEYFAREYRPGETIETAPTALRAHTGDWRAALAEYRRWVETWYRPQVPRKPWFLGCFNYRQHWAWGDLRDQKTGKWRIEEVIASDREALGCLDYLHIFDFGESRVYGRVGDYSHYDELGGREAMAAAIAKAKELGVPVGLYIEGYLCDRRGVWGKENVSRYDIRKADGSPLIWQGDSTEHMMCAHSDGWRDHLAATYRRVAGELSPSGFYIDQYGFLDPWKTCHSREHGHPVPAPPNRGEAATLQAIRAAVPTEIPTITEETPCDVNAQYHDGALGYSVTWNNPELAPHRVDLFRFLFPDFKVFQLVSYNSFTDGAWHLLKWPFFNGEGTWTHNGTAGFSEDALGFLRQSFAILNRYEDAFTSRDVEALVPTLMPTVYANRFTGGEHTVWTLFNAEYHTIRGDLLRVPAAGGGRFLNAFTGKEIKPRRDGKWLILPVEIGPRDVGCIVRW